MAELSYPFNADNADGGSALVSQTQWQDMAAAWVSDFIDLRMTNPGEPLPFASTIASRNVQISAGSAWVGGFYYRNTGTVSVPIADNATTLPRKDLIVIRVDMVKSAANIAVVNGVAAPTPTEPKPTRIRGAVWEMALYVVDVPASNGPITASRRGPFNLAPPVAFPWNAPESAALLPRNTFSLDVDQNTDGVQTEYFNGLDGFAATRDFGGSRNYVPAVLNVDGVHNIGARVGRWRWIAPNTFWFQATIDNNSASAELTGSNWRAGITLPTSASNKGVQTLHGFLSNPLQTGGKPNMQAVTGVTAPGTNSLYLHVPSTSSLSEGLDGMPGFPSQSIFSISGVLEANLFNE